MPARRLEADYVRALFQSKGCVLLSEYVTSKRPLDFRCFCGKVGRVSSLSAFLKGTGRCKVCAYRTKQYEEVRSFFANYDYLLVTDRYVNNCTKMKYVCPKNHTSSMSWSNFKNGKRCPFCYRESTKGSGSPSWNADRDQVKLTRRAHKFLEHALYNAMVKGGDVRDGKKRREILGYSAKELKEHIESHPNWPLVRFSRWHLDHIFPVKAFFEHGITDLKMIHSLDNLRPITAEDNLKKSDYYDEAAFVEWVEMKRNKRGE